MLGVVQLYGLCVGRCAPLHGGQVPPRLDGAQLCCFLSSLASNTWNNYEPNEDKKPAKFIFDINLLHIYFGGAVESLITVLQHFNCAFCFWNTLQPNDWVIITIPWMSRISKIAHGETERKRDHTASSVSHGIRNWDFFFSMHNPRGHATPYDLMKEAYFPSARNS